MTKKIRVRGVRRKQVDEDKLALAFLMLARILHEQDADPTTPDSKKQQTKPARREAA